MALGAAAGGAEALMEIIQQKLRERAQAAQEQQFGQRLAFDREQEAGVDRRFLGGQTFTAGENQKGREFSAGENDKSRTFTAGENQKGREFTSGENDRGRTFTAGENDKSRTFSAGENDKGRTFTAGENEKGRTHAVRIAGMRTAGADSGQFTSVQQVVGPDGKPAFAIIDRRNGTMTPVQNPAGFEPNRPARPVTGSERQTLNFFNRMLEAERNARAVEDKVSGTDLAASEMAPGFIENWLKSKEGQQYSQAQRTYTEARLRKESGAAIPPAEFDSDRRTNFRAMGDKPEALTQKRGSRLQTLKGIGNASGRALQEYYGEGATLEDLLKEFAEAQTATGGAAGPIRYDMNGNPIKK